MIVKNFRLNRNQVNYLSRKGNPFSSRLFVGKYIENNENFSRFCVIISRKISTEAVTRNKLRRQIYESIRTSEIAESAKYHLDIMIVPKKSITTKSFSEIYEEIETLPIKIINQNGPSKNQ